MNSKCTNVSATSFSKRRNELKLRRIQPRGQRCDANLKPLTVQMSLANRVGLLLDLAVLDPPAFRSEAFARWCCEATVSLLARDTQAQTTRLHLAPGMLLAFTPSIPGVDDLPPLELDFVHRPSQTVARGPSSVIAPDGEDVEVLVVIYQMVRNISVNMRTCT